MVTRRLVGSKGPLKAEIDKLLAAYQESSKEQTEELANVFIKQFPQHFFGWQILGVTLLAGGRVSEAITPLQKAASIDPMNAALHNNLANALKELGRLEEAVSSYQKAIFYQPNFVQAHSNLGSALIQLGRYRLAMESCRMAVQLNPSYASAHNNLGNAHKELGELFEAEKCFHEAIRLNPEYVIAHINLGETVAKLGRSIEAEQRFRQAILIAPNNIDAHYALSNILVAEDRYLEAIDVFRIILALRPEDAKIHNNLGVALKNLGHFDEAKSCYLEALRLDARISDARLNLGNIYSERGRDQEAVECYRAEIELNPESAASYIALGNLSARNGQNKDAETYFLSAIALDPFFAEAHNNLGVLLENLGRTAEAESAFGKAVDIRNDYVDALCNLGNVQHKLGKFSEAENNLKRAISGNPRHEVALSNLSNCLRTLGKPMEAEHYARQAISINPSYPEAHCNLANALSAQARLDEAEISYKETLRLKPNFSVAFSNLLLNMLYQEKKPADIWLAHKQYADQFELPFKPDWPRHKNLPNTNRRLKVGYVSADLYNHSVSFFIEPIFQNHDKNKFEIYAYYNNVINDDKSKAMSGHVEHWIECAAIDDASLASRIQDDGIDILVDLSGHTALNRLPVFARKPAPVQVTWMGYPATTGLTAMDYRITNFAQDPVGTTEIYQSEKLLRLPDHVLTYKPAEGSYPINRLPALTNANFTLGCLNNHTKITKRAVELWSNLLAQIPNSRILLGNGAQSAVHHWFSEAFSQLGIASDRLLVQPRLTLHDYLKLHNEIDLSLDPFPYNGGTTTMHSLWMGVPIITMSGTLPHTRVGSFLLKRLELDRFIANSEAEYLDTVVFWSKNLESLDQIRQNLRQLFISGDRSPLSVTRHIEALYLEIWDQWCSKEISSLY
jgi:protein O-GlcNAc transferase